MASEQSPWTASTVTIKQNVMPTYFIALVWLKFKVFWFCEELLVLASKVSIVM